jgi:hypothetical protein
VKRRGKRWMAYDKNVSFGTFDTPYEAAVARAKALGLPPPAQIITCIPTLAQPTGKVHDATTAAVRQWYEAQWARYQPWQTGTLPQQEMRDRFCAASGTPTEHLSVRKLGRILRTCFASDVKAAPHRWTNGTVRTCWFFTPEAACPAHLLAAWEEKRAEEKIRAAERQRAAHEKWEREQAEQRRRREEEDEEEERLRQQDERERICQYLTSKGFDVDDYNIENWMELDYNDPCAASDE